MPSRKNSNAVLVLLRLPVLGAVKSRIASSAGPEVALNIYRELVSITYRLTEQLPCAVHFFFDGGLPAHRIHRPDTRYHHQSNGDLGQRMAAAISTGLQYHNKVLLIGSDCPEISVEIITSAFDALSNADVVLGPAIDGGYYLIGMKKTNPTLFNEIAWGSNQVLTRTVDLCHSDKLSYVLLPNLRDIDTLADWEAYCTTANRLRPLV